MLVLKCYNFKMIQDGPRSYYTTYWEFGQWNKSSPTELLDTYPKTTEEAMREDWEAIVGKPPEVEYHTTSSKA